MTVVANDIDRSIEHLGAPDPDSLDRDYAEELPRIPPLGPEEALASFEADSRAAGNARSLYEVEGREVTSIVEQFRGAGIVDSTG